MQPNRATYHISAKSSIIDIWHIECPTYASAAYFIIKTALTALVFPTEYYGSGDWYIEHAHWVFFVPPSWNKTKLYLIMLYLTHFKKFPKNDFRTRRLLFYCKTIIQIHYFLKVISGRKLFFAVLHSLI